MRRLSLMTLAVLAASALQRSAPAQDFPDFVTPDSAPSFRQVQMHVWISETTERGLRDLGTNLRYTRFVDGVENPSDSLQEVRTNVFDPLNPSFRVTLPAPDQDLFDPPLRPDQQGTLLDGVQTQSGAGLTFSLIRGDHGTIEGVFRSAEEKADVDLISKPELLVIEGMTAAIHAGGEVPFQDIKYDKGVPQLNVAFKQIGVNMVITPTIQPDNFIRLDLARLDVTDLARIDNIRGIDLPVISQRSQTGSVLVPNGQVAVIGGLSSRVIRKTERRVPVVGQVPLLGIFFRGRQSEVTNSHLIVFVAPTVVDLRDLTPSAINALQFWRSGGWRHVERIEQEIDAMGSE